jgi:signal transduction histidine kinase/DNA-binding response OmpR family regulator/ligand-binding sensor domain-containing protein
MQINHFRLCLVVLAVLACAGALRGQEYNRSDSDRLDLVKFEWSNTIGNTSINPSSFLQDSRGLIWMASTSGVASFDGYNFRVYNQKEYNLSTSRTVRLAEDIHGNIWIMGFRNSRIVIDVMNPKTETVVPLHRFLGQEQPVEILLRDEIILVNNQRGKIWVGTLDEGYLYDGKWQKIYSPQQRSGVWWPAPSGVWSYSNDVLYLENYAGDRLDSVPCYRYVWSDEQLNIWSATDETPATFQRITQENGKILVYQTGHLPAFGWIGETVSVPNSSSHRYGYIWRSTGGILYLSRSDGSGTVALNRQFPELGSMGNFYFDREGGIWTANKTKIIHLVKNRYSGFRTLMSEESLDRGVRGMVQIGNQLYVNSYKGDFRINLDNLDISKTNILDGQGICTLRSGNGFWAGGHGGIIAYIEPGKSRISCPLGYQSDVLSLLRCHAGILAATSNGLFVIDSASRSVKPTLLRDIGINYLYRNDRGIWACTTNGLLLIDEQGRTLAQYLQPGPELPYEQLTHLYEDENRDFWLATRGGGLLQWSAEKGIIRKFTTSEGLSNNDIHAVYPDGQGYLWLPGNYGLTRLNKETGNIQVFFKRDGIADSEFNGFSHCRSSDGRLFFGGINGVTVFSPKDIPVPEARTPLLRLIEARTFQLKQAAFINHLPETDGGKPVLVTPDDDYLDIRVSPLIYEEVNTIRYSWKIDGYSDNWVQQQEPLIRLYSLPYGDYTLRIRYTSQGNIWSENELLIPIQVIRPFYLRWPFLLLLTALLIAVASAAGNWRARQLRKANITLEEEVKKRTRQIESDKQVIEQQARELRSLDEVKSRFFANITHELRTPLTLILGPVDSLIKSDSINEKAREYILTIGRNASKLLNLVEELLDLSKMEANKLVLHEKPVWLYQFLTRTISAFSPYAEHRGVKMKLLYNCPGDTTLLMDVQKWDKIINNLLNNALKFTPRGGTVTVTVDLNDNELVISVEDTGSGIHPDDLPYIFDRYYQARTSGANMQGGAGIGLSLCREYIRLFNGEITAESTLDRGSRFTLRCPAKISTDVGYDSIQDTETTFQAHTFHMRAQETPNPAKRTLLLVEDDRDMSEYIQGILGKDYNLLTAENGLNALETLKKQSVDLILSDLMMPEMDGLQLLKAVRERHQDVPFIMLTARADASDRIAALTLGVDDYLTKPFIEDELTTRLKNMLGRYDARVSAQAQTDITGIESKFDQKWLKELEHAVKENMGNPDFSLDELAELLQISRRSLYNRTMTYTGLTPSQYLLEARLCEGRRLLESGGYKTIAEVCYTIGMKTPDYFSKLMKERFG